MGIQSGISSEGGYKSFIQPELPGLGLSPDNPLNAGDTVESTAQAIAGMLDSGDHPVCKGCGEVLQDTNCTNCGYYVCDETLSMDLGEKPVIERKSEIFDGVTNLEVYPNYAIATGNIEYEKHQYGFSVGYSIEGAEGNRKIIIGKVQLFRRGHELKNIGGNAKQRIRMVVGVNLTKKLIWQE